jgi:hypothetical protein
MGNRETGGDAGDAVEVMLTDVDTRFLMRFSRPPTRRSNRSPILVRRQTQATRFRSSFGSPVRRRWRAHDDGSPIHGSQLELRPCPPRLAHENLAPQCLPRVFSRQGHVSSLLIAGGSSALRAPDRTAPATPLSDSRFLMARAIASDGRSLQACQTCISGMAASFV